MEQVEGGMLEVIECCSAYPVIVLIVLVKGFGEML